MPRVRPTREVNGVVEYWCNRGQHFLPANAFGLASSNPTGLKSDCKECRAKYEQPRNHTLTMLRKRSHTPNKICAHCGCGYYLKASADSKYCSKACCYARNIRETPNGLEKRCIKGHFAPLSEFYKQSRTNGLMSECKRCSNLKTSIWQKERNAKRRQQKQALLEQKKKWEEENRLSLRKTCTSCGQLKSIFEFHKEAAGLYGVNSKCIPCARAIAREYGRRPENKESRRAASRKSRAKRRQAAGSHTLKQFYLKCDYHGWRCIYCGEPLNKITVEPDHRKPLSRGGVDYLSNIAPACKPCNRAKHNKTEKEFRAWLESKKLAGVPFKESDSQSNSVVL